MLSVSGLVCRVPRLRFVASIITMLLLTWGTLGTAQAQTAQGSVIGALGSGFSAPEGVAVDRNGNVFVADDVAGLVKEIVAVNGVIPANPTINTLGSGFMGPFGIAVDGSGNVYVGDHGSGLVQEIVAVNGVIPANPTINTLGSGFMGPNGIAVDGSGNVYVADSGSDLVQEIVAVGGVIPPTPTIRTLGSGFSNPIGVAVDGSGNVYVADSFNSAVKEIVAVGGVIPPTPTIRTLASSFVPQDVAVDGSGNVYATDDFNHVVKEIVAVSGVIPATPTINTLTSGFLLSVGVAVDGSGNVYLADSGNSMVKEIQKKINFGSVNLGATSAAQTLTFTFTAAGNGVSVAALMLGVPGLDFADAGSGSCTTNGTSHNYLVGDICTADVTFVPKFPGYRQGEIDLRNTAGAVIASVWAYGTGLGPQVIFTPGRIQPLGSGFHAPYSVAVDGSGNVYVADSGNNEVKEIVAVGGSIPATNPTILPVGSGFSSPYGVAVDGSGNVYVADYLHQLVKEIVAVNGSIPSTNPTIRTLGGFVFPTSVAVDGSGNVYVGDIGNNTVKEIVAVNGSIPATGATILTLGSGFNYPNDVAVDGSGNVYVADGNNNAVKEIVAVNGRIPSTNPTILTLGSGFSRPLGVTVDGSGNVYVADYGHNAVKEIIAVNGSIPSTNPTILTLGSGFNGATGLTVDGSGNIYVADFSNNAVKEIYLSVPPSLSFATTNVGATSSDSPQTVTLENIGNGTLSFSVPPAGSNPSISTNFTLNSMGSTACPLLTPGISTAGTLAAGVSCTLPISFIPTVAGNISGSLVLTDNNLNVVGSAIQTIPLSGTGIQIILTPATLPAGVGGVVYGPVTLTAAGGTGPYTYLVSTGSLPLGLALNPTTGVISGTPTTPGNISFTVTATDSTGAAGSQNYTVTVAAAPVLTTLTLAVTPGSPVTPGTIINLTATLSPALPAGQVIFCDTTKQVQPAPAKPCSDAAFLGIAQLTSSGTATLKVTSAIGNHNYVAMFLGTTLDTKSTSNAVPMTVAGMIPTISSIAATGIPGNYTLTATVASNGSGSLTGPTGSVSFLDTTTTSSLGSAPLGTSTRTQGFVPVPNQITAISPSAVATGDFNGDGIQDLAVGDSGNNMVSIYLGKGDGTFGSPLSVTLASGPTNIKTGDFDGNGILDLAVTITNGQNSSLAVVLLGDGTGNFAVHSQTPTGFYPNALTVGDFNGDGIADIATADYFGGTSTIMLGDGTGNMHVVSTLNATSGLDTPSAVTKGDFNGDGLVDLAFSEGQDSQVSIVLGDGTGHFAASSTLASTFAIGGYSSSIVAGDFNGDGKLDLATANYNINSVSVLLGQGDGTFAAQKTISGLSQVQSLVTGDFNGDGLVDLAVTTFGNNTTSVLLGDGNGNFNLASGLRGSTTGPAEYIASADFNGDGLPDLVTANYNAIPGSIPVAVLLNTVTQTATATLPNVAVAVTPSANPHFADASYAGDGNYTSSASGVVPYTGGLPVNPAGTFVPLLELPVATTLSVTGGGTQSAIVGTQFASPLQLLLLDQFGNPVPNPSMSFVVPGSGASVVLSGAVSSGFGDMSVTATANNTVGGPYTVTATAGSLTATFSLTNLPIPNFVVNTATDDGNVNTNGIATNCNAGNTNTCTLRDAIAAASAVGNGTITFDPTVFGTTPVTIPLNTAGLTLPSGIVNITGPGANLLTVNGEGIGTVVTVNNGVTGAVSGVTLAGGNGPTAGGVSNAGSLTLTNDAVSGNTSAGTGGVNNTGTLTVTGSTISGNTSSAGAANAGGIANIGGTAIIVNSTITQNNATGGAAAGIYNTGILTVEDDTISQNVGTTGAGGITNIASGTVTAQNNILAGNTAPGGDFTGFSPDNSNITNATGLSLASLGYYGGTTQTLPPVPASTAICGGVIAEIYPSLVTDQRGTGYPRTTSYSGTSCVDAGAVQANFSLVFATQPTDTVVNASVTPSPAVQLEESGVAFPYAGTVIPVSFGAGSTGALHGTLSENTNASGIATYSGLSGDTVGTGDSLLATVSVTTAQSLTAPSTPFQITQASTVPTFTVNPVSPVYGQSATVTITVPATGGTPPTGTVTVYDNGNPIGTGTLTTGSNGTVVVTLPGGILPAGTDPITVGYGGDPNYGTSTSAPQSVTVSKAPLTAAITGNPTKVFDGTTTATLTSANYSVTGFVGTDGATVTQAVGTYASATVGTNDTMTAALIPANFTAVGTTNLANYTLPTTASGTGTITAATSVPTIVVGPTTTPVYGQPVTVTVTVPTVGGSAPMGTVTIYDNGNPIGTGTVGPNGTVTVTLPGGTLPAGSGTITAGYGGGGSYGSSTSAATAVNVSKALLTISISGNPTKVFDGTTTATLTSANYSLTGFVGNDGATVSQTVGVYAAATAGPETVTASLSATNFTATGSTNLANYALPTTASGSGTIGKVTSTPTVTVGPSTPVYGQPVTVTVTVPTIGGTVPTGPVIIYDNGNPVGTGTLGPNGTVTVTLPGGTLPVGPGSITVGYPGDGNYGISTSAPASVTVAQVASTLVWPNPAAITYGTALSSTQLDATASTAGSYVYTQASGTVLNAGTYTLSVAFTPTDTTDYTTATATVPLTVNKQPTTSSLALSATSIQAGAAVTLSVKVSPVSSGMPTGTVTIFDNGTALTTMTLSSAAGTFTTSTLAVGTHVLSTIYSGDTNYLASTASASSGATTITVTSLDFVVGTTTPSLTVDPGAIAAFTITVGPAGQPFSSPVTLSVTGLPANFTATFLPLTVTPGGATVTSQMSVQTYAAVTAKNEQGKGSLPYGLIATALLLPLLSARKLRKKLPKGLLYLLLLSGTFSATAALTGCGGGYFGPRPASYTLTVTGTSGSLQHSTTVTLNVQ